MLPSELLTVWKRKGVIWPRYAKLSDENLSLANALIDAYRRHIGEKKNILKKFTGELEDKGYDYRFVRGLSLLLDRRGFFKSDAKINPIELRRRIYRTVQKSGIPTTPAQRSRTIETVASDLKLPAETIEASLYADLDSELILERFDPIPATELLEEYNLSLTQTLLFDSTELSFTASGNWQNILYTAKKLGLIYEAYQDRGFWMRINGPASLFKLTRRYGSALAKLLPAIIASPEWTVEAKILWKYTNEICSFKIESSNHNVALKRRQPQVTSYDSLVEEDFALRFQALKSGWCLKREPEPVSAGKQVIIPDFSFEREGIKVYMEIVGFWTKEYLMRKIDKLKKIDAEMLVAVNEALACERLMQLEKHEQLNMIYYRDKIPLAQVLHYLEQAFEGVHTSQTSFVKNLPIIFMEPIVDYEEFAGRIGVSTEAVRTALTEKTPKDYVALPNSLVRKDKLELIGTKIKEQINPTGRLPLLEALKIIEDEGIQDATSVLEAFGYRITWHGISTEKAEIHKPENQSK